MEIKIIFHIVQNMEQKLLNLGQFLQFQMSLIQNVCF